MSADTIQLSIILVVVAGIIGLLLLNYLEGWMPIDTGTTNLTSQNTISTAPISAHAIVVISEDGRHVKIDWNAVEEAAINGERLTKAIAKSLLAVRDKTYEPMDDTNGQ